MVLITINVPQEIKDKIKLEENQSALITKLLNDHYKYNIENIEDLDINLKNLDEEKKKMLEKIEKEREKIVQIKEHRVETEFNEEELKKLKEQKRETLINNVINNAKEVFNIDITKEQANDYINSDYRDIKSFLKIEDNNELGK